VRPRILGPGDPFAWCVGIEDTAIGQPIRHSGHALDEYELTQHYRFWREDIDRAASLGVSGMRYGIPWYRVNPAPGHFEWGWVDAVLDHAVGRRGLAIIADLVHYGVPGWVDGSFADPAYPTAVAEFARAFAERYRGAVAHYTPLNEPTITAQFCGQRGLWAPYLRGEEGWLAVVIGVVEGIRATIAAIREADPDARIVHVEAAKVVRTDDPELRLAAAQVEERNYLPTDLLLGRVGPEHPLAGWIEAHGGSAERLERLAGPPPAIDVIGVNYYPEISVRELVHHGGMAAEVAIDGWAEGLAAALRGFLDRYRLPVFVSETSTDGDDERRIAWLTDSVRAVRSLRDEGLPVVGYTWWPLFDFVDWSHSIGAERLEDFLVRARGDSGEWELVRPLQPSDNGSRDDLTPFLRRMGLWSLAVAPDRTLRRDESAAVEAYRGVVAEGR
jgi:beta-glucosidase